MPLFGSYEKAGSGIAKNAPPKKPFFRFWEILGRKFWKLMELNMMMCLTLIPLVLAALSIFYLAESYTTLSLIIAAVMVVIFAVIFGPSMAAVAKILRYFTLEKPCFLFDMFIKTFKSSFKMACPLGLIDLLVATSVASGFYVYPRLISAMEANGEEGTGFYYVLFVLTISIAIVITLMSFYGYLIIVSTELNFKQILKDSLALSIMALKTNVITLVLSAVIMGIFIGLTLYFPFIMLFVWFFMPTAYVGFLIVFNCYPVIQKTIFDPYYSQRGELSPEMGFAETSGENVFEDQGGKEAPIEPKKKGKNGNIVS
ncbi:MAG: hypothetical protein II916_00095 [Oscillospiraceae bacterium]|nr:hypothetical protein [Oscillospiraceae bacterium]